MSVRLPFNYDAVCTAEDMLTRAPEWLLDVLDGGKAVVTGVYFDSRGAKSCRLPEQGLLLEWPSGLETRLKVPLKNG